MTDREFIDAVKAAIDRGVRVRIVMTQSFGEDLLVEPVGELARYGAELHTLAVPYIHAKLLLVDGARAFIDGLSVFSRMTGIGDTRSMALHAATTTHVTFTQEHRDRLGVDDGLIRLSIGIETVEDLIADLRQALDAVGGGSPATS